MERRKAVARATSRLQLLLAGSRSAPPMASSEEQTEPRPPVLLLRRVAPAYDAAVSEKFHLLRPWESPLPRDQFLAAHAGSVRALLISGLVTLDAATLDALPRLGCVVTTSAGVNHIDLAACARRGIAVANAGTVFSPDAADYAVGLLIDVLRRVSASDRYVRRGLWPVKGDYPLGFKLGSKRVGIVGLGSIGSQTAKRLEAFGCTILYYSRKNKPSVPYKYLPNVCDLAAESDVLVVSCALTSETHHIINKDVMAALGKEGIIINVGRGPLVDEDELVRRLMQGELGGAGLDVFENEPAVPKELFLMDNVVLSPHRAVFTSESFADLGQLLAANLEAFFSNRPLLTPVNQNDL
ncbi:glyoxylate/hydroxypyruvate reductase HPR3-like [Phoenix dactylifera]|uniref:Glyoxylate/hydroxypyruvate reductase HPR3-like n=1 Tax=Phoenix dactylifera TaxID=42345 RepID=A0A8B7BR52_PHODC|nr:glyoxylate/hydroxypyruvate reductase HPR3-like [Phoenix dactylifera]